MKFIPGYSLSSKCGDEYYRCQELLVVNDSQQFSVQNKMDHSLESLSIVFAPLETGVLLLCFWYDSNAMTMQWNTSIVNSSNCTPTAFYTINGTFYMVCISSYYEEHYNVAVYEVQLNFNGSGTTLAEQTAINITISDSSLNFSNFIIVDHRIYFAIGSTIVVLYILDSTQKQQYPELLVNECPQIYKLVPDPVSAGDQQIQAYCTDRYILFDSVYGDWTEIHYFSSNGVPYLCPDNSYRATLFFNGTLQFSVRNMLTSTINNINISSGVCFESQSRTYFAYSDQQYYTVYVYDFIGRSLYPVSPYFCLQECPQLFTLDDQYLVIRDADRDRILDTKTNFSLIFNISSGIADILVILHGNISAITPSPPIIPSATTESASSSMNNIVVTSTSISTPNYTHAPNPSPSVTVHTSSASTTTTASPGIIIIMYALWPH
jgi:hypothetical protein